MVTIPLYIFLFIFFIALLILAIFYFIDLAHIVATANLTFVSFVVTSIVFILVIAVLYGTWFFLQGTDWQQTIKIWDNQWIGGESSLPF
jgi:hypothetical protein